MPVGPRAPAGPRTPGAPAAPLGPALFQLTLCQRAPQLVLLPTIRTAPVLFLTQA